MKQLKKENYIYLYMDKYIEYIVNDEIDENVEVNFNGMNIIYNNDNYNFTDRDKSIELVFPVECYNQVIIVDEESEIPIIKASDITVDYILLNADERREFAKQGHDDLLENLNQNKLGNDLYMTAITIKMMLSMSGFQTLKYSN